MTAEQLRHFKHKVPFATFKIHLSDGSDFTITDPESLVLPKDWTTDAIVTMPRNQFAFIYLKNVTHVSSAGGFPRIKGRRGRSAGPNGGAE